MCPRFSFRWRRWLRRASPRGLDLCPPARFCGTNTGMGRGRRFTAGDWSLRGFQVQPPGLGEHASHPGRPGRHHIPPGCGCGPGSASAGRRRCTMYALRIVYLPHGCLAVPQTPAMPRSSAPSVRSSSAHWHALTATRSPATPRLIARQSPAQAAERPRLARALARACLCTAHLPPGPTGPTGSTSSTSCMGSTPVPAADAPRSRCTAGR